MADEIELIALAHSDIGRVKPSNEDAYLIDKRLRLYVVADGMGGHAAGDVASDTAIREIRQHVRTHDGVVAQFVETADSRVAVGRMLESAVRGAGRAIFELARSDPSKRGMGTTVSLLLITPTRGFIAHVGDSRVYLVRQGEVFQLTEDHSLINELIKRGKLTPEEAADAPYQNAVTRAVGVYEEVEVDVLDFEIAGGDDFVLCSDGLTAHVDDDEIGEVVRGHDLLAVPKRFIELANARGGKDNITSLVVRLARAGDADEIALKLNVLRKMPLFRPLTYVELVEVLNVSELHRYEAGAIIFEERHEGDALYVVLEGRVAISKQGTVLARLDEGHFFGEMALMDKSPRSATVSADAPTRCIVVRRGPLFGLMRRDKEIAVKLLWSFVQVLNQRLRETSADLASSRRENLDLRADFIDIAEIEDLE